MERFLQTINDASLTDIRIVGSLFTWFNKREDTIYRKLDRIMGNDQWLQQFGNAEVFVKPNGLSDHCPLLLQCNLTKTTYNKPFQFFTFLTKLPEYNDTVLKAWSTNINANPWVKLHEKLKLVKKSLVELNKKHGRVPTLVKEARDRLHLTQASLMQDRLNKNLIELEKAQSIALSSLLIQEESLMRQKSRVKWLQEGDSNTSFFFNQVKANWNVNKILSVKNKEGDLIKGHDAVAGVAVDYYKDALASDHHHCSLSDFDFDKLSFEEITTEQANVLDMNVNSDLILQTLKTMKKGKAPGPDGFTADFFTHSWDIVGDDFTGAIHYFFSTGYIPKAFQATAIAMIPKCTNPTEMTEYRPISLCTTIYKCISKILANRLKTVMATIIDKAQAAFIPGRKISDNILLAQELFRGYGRSSGSPKCAIKVDLQKAFDSVNWDFLWKLLSMHKIPPKFIYWIKACVSNPYYSVKLNGTLAGFFKGNKGLRQGDPLSPYLFAIVMNALSSSLNSVNSEFKFHWKCKELRINHLFFADDAIFLCHASKDSISFIMDTIYKFGNASGLRPNLSKSNIFFANATADVIHWFEESFNVPHGVLPMKFLGVPLISSMLSVNDCIPLIQKLRKRIGSWTTKFLSYGGRLVLLRSTIFAMQSFWSAHFILPTSVIQTIDQIMKRFLWRGSDERGGAKVAWSTICLPKCQGGLDFKDTKSWNKAQIMFHLWQVIRRNSKSLWAMWIRSSVLHGKPFWSIPIPTDCSWIWRKVLALREEARPFVQYSIGNGNHTSLWFDPWYQHTCISPYPSSALIDQSGLDANAKVSAIINDNVWCLPCLDNSQQADDMLVEWVRNFNHSITFDPSKDDTVSWNGTAEGKVKARTIWLDLRISASPVTWCGMVWNRLRIPRYAFIHWIVMHGRLPTLERLSSFGFQTNQRCYLCINAVENQQHLFITCHYSRYILAKLLNMISSTALPESWNSMTNFLLSLTSPHKDIAFIAFQIYIYHVWRERNSRAHDKGSSNPDKLLKGIILDLRSRASTSTWFIKQTIKYPLLQHWLM